MNYATPLVLQYVAAALALDAGDLRSARNWLEAHDRWLAFGGSVLGRAEGSLLWAQYHQTIGDHPRARQYAELSLTYATDPRQPLSLIAAHRFLGQLGTDEGQLAFAQDHLQQALVLADACAAPFERALTLLALAELRAAQHQSDQARVLLDEVVAIATPLQARPTLGRAERLAARLAVANSLPSRYPAGLTVREVDVLRLVASGRSNREIAEALSISIRTVERHITNLYAKIGARGKADATAFAYRHQLV